jgi:hypothetical protein
LAVFTIPFTKASEDQRYADIFTPPLDLTNVQFIVRLYAPGATAGQLIFYFSGSNSGLGGGGTFFLKDYASAWKEITLNVGPSLPAASPPFDAGSVKQLTIEAVSGGSGPWTPSPVVVYIDVVRSTNGLINDTFDSMYPPMFISMSQPIAGATLAWANTVP